MIGSGTAGHPRHEPAVARDLLHRVAMLLAADRPTRDLLDPFAELLVTYCGANAIVFDMIGEGERRHERDGGTSTIALQREAAVAISLGGRTIGTLRMEWTDASAYDEDDVTLLESCVMQLGARFQDETQRAERERLEQVASTDALTGLANRRTFDETLAREWKRCARSQSPLGLLMLDVDFFKGYNDTYGHAAGDKCLQQIAAAIAASTKRPGDLACRYGGEEFVVILPETGPEDAAVVAETICDAVRALQLPHQGSSLGYATVSVGCWAETPLAVSERTQLTQRADLQLYRAKEHGRNRVATAAYLGESPAAERRVTPRHNLPASRTQFFGRDEDIDAMAVRLRSCRLLTIAGPGGVGKTRLATEFGRRYASRYVDGVWFVDFAPLIGGMFVAPTVLAALGVREESGRAAEDTLTDHLREKNALVILDNCEHLVAQAAELTDRLLAECAALHVCATSRQVLEVEGESVYRVSTFNDEDGIALFVSRAQAVAASFSLTGENAETVKGICRRLDGIPLAIELAAARMRMMKVDELSKRLDDRFRVLTGGARGPQSRQQTLYETIEWSYNLLDDVEKVLLRRLAVYAGSFSLGSATATCASDPIDPLDVLDVLARLIDKSLVQFDPASGRYALLESTKQFGLDRLRESGEWELLQRRHAECMRDLASSAEKQFAVGSGDRGRLEIAANYADCRAVMQWALVDGEDVMLGAAIAASLGWYWSERGQWREGRFWLERALAVGSNDFEPVLRARIHLGLAVALYVEAEFSAMLAEARRAEEAYAVFNDVTGLASARNLAAIAAQHAGRMEEAHDLLQSVLVASREIKNVRLEAVALGNLAELFTDWKSDYAGSEGLYERAARIHRDLANSFPLGVTLGDWSATAAYQGDFDRAEALAVDALTTFRGIGEEMRVIEQLIRIGHYRIWAGRLETARAPLSEMMLHLRATANVLYCVRAAEAVAELAIAFGDAKSAATLLAFSQEQRGQKMLARPVPVQDRIDRATDSAKAALGEDAFTAIWEDGRLLAVQAALDVAESLLRD